MCPHSPMQLLTTCSQLTIEMPGGVCSTAQGKESILRQLEPGLHIDGDPVTVSSLGTSGSRLVASGSCSCAWRRRWLLPIA